MALFALGAVSAAYGALMAVLYPAGGFFLVWIALGAALVAAGRIQKIRRAVCGVCAALLVAGNASAADAMPLKGAHKAMNLPCEACHGNIKPREVPEESACMTCHQSREAVKAKTAKLKPNPHFGHDETVECTACHKEHQQSVLICDECHQWGYKTP